MDRVLVSENCLAISKTCLHVPDLSIHWLVRLSQSYTEGYSEVFLPEAAQCLVACASITIQHLLRWTNCPVWGAEHLRTLQKICPDMPVIFPNLLKAGREKISPSKSFVATHFQLGIGALSVKSDMDADCHESCRHHQTIFGDRSVELGGAVFPTDTHLLEEKVRNKLANALIQISKERHSEDGSEDGSFGLKKRASSEYFRSSWKAKPSRSVHDIGKDISRVIGFSEVTVERVLQHLHAASELFRRAGFTEAAAELIEVAIPVYKCRHDYKEVIKCHSVLASICNSMCLQAEMWEEPTIDAVYFRVGFLGDRFGSRLAGKQFVYREDRWVLKAFPSLFMNHFNYLRREESDLDARLVCELRTCSLSFTHTAALHLLQTHPPVRSDGEDRQILREEPGRSAVPADYLRSKSNRTQLSVTRDWLPSGINQLCLTIWVAKISCSVERLRVKCLSFEWSGSVVILCHLYRMPLVCRSLQLSHCSRKRKITQVARPC